MTKNSKGIGGIEKMVSSEKWSVKEEDVVKKYFNNNVTQMTLYQQLQQVNPNRTYEAMKHKLRKLRAEGSERKREKALSKLKVGFLDIESSDLRADWGYMLSWCIKTAGKKEYIIGRISRADIAKATTSNNVEFDARITGELLDALRQYDVVWAHYGSDWRFDLPYIRTRAFANGLQDRIPKAGELFIKDTYPLVKKKLKLQSNRLGNIAEVLGIKEKKSPVTPRMWKLARIGNPEALDYVEEHNIRDVEVLEKVYNKLAVIDTQPYVSI